jgi:TldD protein
MTSFYQNLLDTLTRRGGDLGEIFHEDNQALTLVLDDNRLEQVVGGVESGIGLRLIAQGRQAYTYSNDMEAGVLERLAASLAGRQPLQARLKPLPPLERQKANGREIKNSPLQVPLEAKLDLVQRLNRTARAVDKRVRQVKVRYGESLRRITIANSLGLMAREERPQLVVAIQCVAEEKGLLQTGYEVVGGAAGWEALAGAEEAAVKAGERAARLLSARPAPGGSMTVVLAASAGGTMIHEAVGHGLEADLVWEKLSVYAGRLGQKVASPLISVVDDGTLPAWRGSASFDDEGAPTRRTLLIENGILRTYMTDWLSAGRLGLAQSGNGRRESYRHQPVCRMTNTMILPGQDDPEEIIASTPYGLLVSKMGGGQVNTVNGDFVFEVAEGFRLEKGKKGELVRGATLVGNGPRVLMEIDRLAADLGSSIGTCGKDGQGVPVGDAQPTLRIPQIVVGGQDG